MGCLKLTYHEETERPIFLGVWKKSDGPEKSTNYQSFGSVLREQKYDPDQFYKWAYQGQYSERDQETDWQHFQLRAYDPVIGRWTSVDPFVQNWSPYIGMNNDPVNRLDPDGGAVDINGKGGFYRLVYGVLSPLINGIGNFFKNKFNAFWNSFDFVADVNFKVDLGIAAKIKGNVGVAKAQADINVATVNLWNVKGDLTKFDWSHDYVGENGDANVTNSIGVGVYLPIKTGSKTQFGIGAYAEQHQRIHNGFSRDYGNSAGLDFLGKSTATKSLNNFPGKEPSAGGKLGKTKDFYGLDLGAGAQLILGVDVSLKIGFKR